MFAASKGSHPLIVFLAALTALTVSTALAVGLGWIALRTLLLDTIKLAAGLASSWSAAGRFMRA